MRLPGFASTVNSDAESPILQPMGHEVEQPFEFAHFQIGWRAAADENRADRLRLLQRGHFRLKCLEIEACEVVLAGHNRKIAIAAVMRKKGRGYTPPEAIPTEAAWLCSLSADLIANNFPGSSTSLLQLIRPHPAWVKDLARRPFFDTPFRPTYDGSWEGCDSGQRESTSIVPGEHGVKDVAVSRSERPETAGRSESAVAAPPFRGSRAESPFAERPGGVFAAGAGDGDRRGKQDAL